MLNESKCIRTVRTRKREKLRKVFESIPADIINSLRMIFINLDDNNDGFIGIKEVQQYHSDIGQTMTEEELINEYFPNHTNHEFKLSFEEFASIIPYGESKN